MILRNATQNEIRQVFCQRTYIWGPGEAMTLPDNVAGWMLGKVNSREGGNYDPNDPERKLLPPRLVPEKAPAGKKEQIPDPNILRSEIKAVEKPAETPKK